MAKSEIDILTNDKLGEQVVLFHSFRNYFSLASNAVKLKCHSYQQLSKESLRKYWQRI